jgi:hypothetical protein
MLVIQRRIEILRSNGYSLLQHGLTSPSHYAVESHGANVLHAERETIEVDVHVLRNRLSGDSRKNSLDTTDCWRYGASIEYASLQTLASGCPDASPEHAGRDADYGPRDLRTLQKHGTGNDTRKDRPRVKARSRFINYGCLSRTP